MRELATARSAGAKRPTWAGLSAASRRAAFRATTAAGPCRLRLATCLISAAIWPRALSASPAICDAEACQHLLQDTAVPCSGTISSPALLLTVLKLVASFSACAEAQVKCTAVS